MQFKFVPGICQGEAPTYKGHIIINVPKTFERHEYIRQSGVLAHAGKDGKFELSDQYETMTKMMSFVEKHIAEVDLVRLSDGLRVKKEEVMCVASLEPAVMELCVLFMKGFEPGKI